jgi:hypothetical protein
MHPFIKSIFRKIREATARFIESYVLETHGEKAKVCFLWGDNNDVCFSMNRINGRYSKEHPMINFIRKLCGENTLVSFGLPLLGRKLPCVYLFVFPSLLGVLGLKKTRKLIKNWRGNSMVGSLTVVEYKLFGRK